MKKAGQIISNILVTVILIFSILMTVVAITSTKTEIGEKTGLPNLFGKALFAVKSDSMDGGDTGFKMNSLIIVDLVDHANDDKVVYKVGDVVTFWGEINGQQQLNTHRIVEDTVSPQHEIKDGISFHGGSPRYLTKGDKRTANIDLLSNDLHYKTNENIIAVWTGVEIPLLGGALMFLQKPEGFAICVVIPTLIFFLFELFKFISILMENKKQKAVEAVKGAEEEIKQKVIAEMLANQAKAEQPTAPAAEAASTAADEEAKRKALEEEIKQKAIAEYLAQQETEKQKAQAQESENK